MNEKFMTEYRLKWLKARWFAFGYLFAGFFWVGLWIIHQLTIHL